METSQIQSRTWPKPQPHPAQATLPAGAKVPQGSGTLSYCGQLLRSRVTSALHKQKSSRAACSWLSVLRRCYERTLTKNVRRPWVLLATTAPGGLGAGRLRAHTARACTSPPMALLSAGAPGAPNMGAGRQALDAGCWTLGAGCWMLDWGCFLAGWWERLRTPAPSAGSAGRGSAAPGNPTKPGAAPARLGQTQLKPAGNSHSIMGYRSSVFITAGRYRSMLLLCLN